MKKIYFSLFIIGAFTISNAQQFQEVETSIKDFYYSSSAIGDIDGDGKPDILITGGIGQSLGNWNQVLSEVYKNDGTSFQLQGDLGQYSVRYGDVKFIDFDNDGLLDIVTTGHDNENNVKQFRFKNTGDIFEFQKELIGIIQGDLDVFDFNHDGYLDYAQNGSVSQYSGTSKNLDLFINNKNGFDEKIKWMAGTFGGSFKFVDLNNDGDLDLVIFGFKEDNTSIFNIYMNENGNYVLKKELPPVTSGKMAYADFDADGNIDLVVVGQDDDYDEYLAVYYNDGNWNFTEQSILRAGLTSSYVDVGDLNNDGYYDFIIKGNDSSYNGRTKVYTYDPEQKKFTLKANTGLQNLSGSGGRINIFDYDGDNIPDVLITGEDRDNWEYLPDYTLLYRNTISTVNERPKPPVNFTITDLEDRIIFNWSGASDDKTPENALQYEINVGTASGKSDIAKYTVTGKNWYLLKESLPSTFYWSIKSIDASKIYSDKSMEQEVKLLGTNEVNTKQVKLYPNPTKDFFNIDVQEEVESIIVYNVNGQKVRFELDISKKRVLTNEWQEGVYFVEVTLKNGTKISNKIIKK